MSHSHSHAPGQPHNHSHGPQPPQQPQQPQATMAMRPPDPLMQAVIEESFRPVDLALGPPENATALCAAHKLEKCADCGEDFRALNRLSRLLVANPNLRCPPPPQVVSQNLTQAISNTKDEGNVRERVLGACSRAFCAKRVPRTFRHCSRAASTYRPSNGTPWPLASPSSARHGRPSSSCAKSSP
ncbi:hypothetical protein FKP32DRAFT_212961 [Trametes sanguinea]|nr:hypothetical protein FKP32DRAFT_212961 [Trametes sanguinea]